MDRADIIDDLDEAYPIGSAYICAKCKKVFKVTASAVQVLHYAEETMGKSFTLKELLLAEPICNSCYKVEVLN